MYSEDNQVKITRKTVENTDKNPVVERWDRSIDLGMSVKI
ncbi:hypothetical protein NIES3974_47410 [Calothrix sp. NIES-3974]|nr:hypothetical protein NIES3974_47410 [Calothrix sp. NIES-3974]